MTKTGNSNPFECIPMDQTFLQIVNNDTQTLGAKGFSTKKGAITKYHFKVEYRAFCA